VRGDVGDRPTVPLGLFLLESVIADRSDFANKLATDPTKLWSQTAGGVEVHAKRIQKVLDVLDEGHRFNADYLAQLRYDKKAQDRRRFR
jgi:hypothetical protein